MNKPRDTVYVVNWLDGLDPDPVDDLTPLNSAEIRPDQSSQSDYPCPKCGGSLWNWNDKCNEAHANYREKCKYCMDHMLSLGHCKVKGSECSICGPTQVKKRGGYPRRQVRHGVDRYGEPILEYVVVYDLNYPQE